MNKSLVLSLHQLHISTFFWLFSLYLVFLSIVIMASIPTMTQEVENAINYTSVLQNHHSKTLDIGLNGYTMSTGQLGDVSTYEMFLNLSKKTSLSVHALLSCYVLMKL
jgi:hypothetical protein